MARETCPAILMITSSLAPDSAECGGIRPSGDPLPLPITRHYVNQSVVGQFAGPPHYHQPEP